MRVTVYQPVAGLLRVLVEPTLGAGKPPVLLSGVRQGTFRDQVLPVLEAARRGDLPSTP